MNDEHEYLEDVAVYALGALPQEDVARVREHLATCAICQEEYRALAPVVDAYATSAEAVDAPSPLLKRRIMREVEGTRAPSRFAYGALAACAALVVVIGSALFVVANDRARLSAELADISAPGAQHYAVPHGQVIRVGAHVYIALQNAPPPPPGKTYEAWTLPAGSTRMEPSSTFVPKAGSALVRLPANGEHIVAVAMSVEPAGGSEQPTTTPNFVVKLH